MRTAGIHHVTAIAGAAQPHLDFYLRLLGLRLVKQTVNFDDPGAYHFYYGDRTGRPGTIFTAFPYENALPGRTTAGMITATAFAVSEAAIESWMHRLADADADFDAPGERFGQPVLTVRDPDGMTLDLVGSARASEDAGLSGLHSVTLSVQAFEATARLLAETMGYEAAGEENGRLRFHVPDGEKASVVDLNLTAKRDLQRGGAGTYHHVAFRAKDEDELLAWRETFVALGFNVTPVRDRQYFKSIYFREPSGILFEFATDVPGFLIDEPEAELGTHLKLPPWLEPKREAIEARLPVVQL